MMASMGRLYDHINKLGYTSTTNLTKIFNSIGELSNLLKAYVVQLTHYDLNIYPFEAIIIGLELYRLLLLQVLELQLSSSAF